MPEATTEPDWVRRPGSVVIFLGATWIRCESGDVKTLWISNVGGEMDDSDMAEAAASGGVAVVRRG